MVISILKSPIFNRNLDGSFRNFILTVNQEIQSPKLKIFCKCPSAGAGLNKDSLILCPGPISYNEEEVLYFFGQVTNIS
jgi:hypothetical protein